MIIVQSMNIRFLLKKEILDLLISNQAYFTSQNIKDTLGQSNTETIQELCHEMIREYEEMFDKQDTLLEIRSGEGVRFVGNVKYVSQYYEYLMVNDLAYSIVIHAFFKQTSINSMTRKYSISYSTLRRRVIGINKYLQPLDLQITMRERLNVEGNEYTKRIFIFLFLYYVHTEIQNIDIIINKQKYSSLAKLLNRKLNLDIPEVKLDGFAIWIYVTEQAINSDATINFPKSLQPVMDDDALFPEKPEVLKHWSMDEWKFFCLIISINGLFTNESIINLSPFIDSFKETHLTWFDMFGEYYRPLNTREEKYLEYKVTQIYIITELINLYEEMVYDFFSVRYKEMRKRDNFTSIFEAMWDKYRKMPNAYAHSFIKVNSYFMCRNLLNANNFRIPVNVYLLVKGGPIFVGFIEEKIRNRFKVEYDITYVKSPEYADIVIANMPYQNDRQILTTYISNSISKHDNLRILHALQYFKRLSELELREEKNHVL